MNESEAGPRPGSGVRRNRLVCCKVRPVFLHPRAEGYDTSRHMLEPLHDVMVVQFPTSACVCERKWCHGLRLSPADGTPIERGGYSLHAVCLVKCVGAFPHADSWLELTDMLCPIATGDVSMSSHHDQIFWSTVSKVRTEPSFHRLHFFPTFPHWSEMDQEKTSFAPDLTLPQKRWNELLCRG